MYKLCKTEQSLNRQNEIADAFIQTLKKQQLSTISISKFCQSANIPRKTFYRYFDTLEDIILFKTETFGKKYIEYNRSLFIDESTNYQKSFEKFLNLWKDNIDFIEALCNNTLMVPFAEHMIRCTYDTPDTLQYIYHNEDIQLISDTISFFMNGLLGFLTRKQRLNEPIEPSQLSAILSLLTTTPLFYESLLTKME